MSPLLGNLFFEMGMVVDVFISKKIRKNKSCGFGFVRYQRENEAAAAINAFNGSVFMGLKISVSMAKKYNKLGEAFAQNNACRCSGKFCSCGVSKRMARKGNHFINIPAYRDGRRYADVVMGNKKDDHRAEDDKVIPVLFDLKVDENQEIVKKLEPGACHHWRNIRSLLFRHIDVQNQLT